MYEVGTIAAIVETIRLPDATLKTVIEGKMRARLSHFSVDEEFARAEAEEIEEPAISDGPLESLIGSVLAAFVREQVRTVPAWVNNPDATGVSAAATILREGWNAKQVAAPQSSPTESRVRYEWNSH
jgi:Lon protease-like protein